jgi:hypothetical protein
MPQYIHVIELAVIPENLYNSRLSRLVPDNTFSFEDELKYWLGIFFMPGLTDYLAFGKVSAC